MYVSNQYNTNSTEEMFDNLIILVVVYCIKYITIIKYSVMLNNNIRAVET